MFTVLKGKKLVSKFVVIIVVNSCNTCMEDVNDQSGVHDGIIDHLFISTNVLLE